MSESINCLRIYDKHCCFFFFNDTATTEIYSLPLHDALPISYRNTLGPHASSHNIDWASTTVAPRLTPNTKPNSVRPRDRKSTRLNSSHGYISYAVFCLKKKNNSKVDTIADIDRF